METPDRLVLWVFCLVVVCFALTHAWREAHGVIAMSRARDWRTRALAVERINADPALQKRADVRRALVGLMDRESGRTSEVSRGVAAPDEGFAEHVSAVISLLRRAYGMKDPEALGALVRAPWKWDSTLAGHIVAEGGRALPLLLARIRNETRCGATEDAISAGQAMMLVGRILGQERLGRYDEHLSPEAMKEATDALVSAAAHSNVIQRRHGVAALGWSLDRAVLPLLARIAESDPDDGRGNLSRLPLDVRSEARRAIERIRTRSDAVWR